ncbi:MAG: patatin-like phospholipase family protein [Pseudomonadota bacterium]
MSNTETKIALCLPGGGATSAMFQIGALAAFEDSVDALQVNNFDFYVGSSGGASVAAALAGGLPVQRIYRAFLDPADVYFGLERKHLLRIDLGEWRRTLVSALGAVRHGASSLLSRSSAPAPAALWEELDRLYDSLPAGLFTLDGYERFLEDFFVRRGVPNSFHGMPRPLRIMAHDLDSGRLTTFGEGGSADVSVTRACIASMAVPPFFSPVRIGERHYINAGAGQVEHLQCAIEHGANVLIVVNPMVASSVASVPTGHGHRDSLRDKGMMWVLNQSMRIGIHKIVREECARIVKEGRAQVILIEPSPEDIILFMYNPASFDARRAILEYAYRHTRAELAKSFADKDGPLARAGLRPRTTPSSVLPPNPST